VDYKYPPDPPPEGQCPNKLLNKMPYLRKRAYRKKRSYARSTKRGGPRRRFGVKKRTYRKKASPRMTTKRILNVASIKKRDTMLPITNATLDPDELSSTLPMILLPGRPVPPRTPAYTYCIPWIPTARQVNTFVGPAQESAQLTSPTPYYVGLSEKITLTTTGASPWQWRRICFTLKGPILSGTFTSADDNEYEPEKFYRESYGNGVGEYRPMYDLASYYGGGTTSTIPRALQRLYATVFQGTSSQFSDNPERTDWINVIDAKTDSTRVKICYDKTVTISSGNDEGISRQYTRWHPMRKTLVYDNIESGSEKTFSNFSTDGKPGMGDYYVIDLFQNRYGADGGSGNLIFDPRATLYWHER